MALNIISTNLSWNGTRTTRSSTTHLIIHHSAGTGTVQAVHNLHKDIPGTIGIGYNFYIRTDGSIYEGRGWQYSGAHTVNYNSCSIGICCEGNYETTSTVPLAQLRSVVELGAEALKKYPTIKNVGGHNDYDSTACPGKNFPKSDIVTGIRQYSNVLSACNQLKAKGVINTPDYWVANFWRLSELTGFILSSAPKCKPKSSGKYRNVLDAITALYDASYISSKDYWRGKYASVQYLDELLINIANRI